MKLITKAIDRLYLAKQKKQLEIWRQSIIIYLGILLTWGFYRQLMQLPPGVEETILKGLVFGVPVFYVTFKKNRQTFLDLGITNVNLQKAVVLGIIFGISLGFAGQLGAFIKYGALGVKTSGFDLPAIGNFILLAVFTAFWEQLVFAGFLLGRLGKVIHNEWKLVSLVGAMFALIHVPALIIIQRFMPLELLGTTLLLWSLSVGSNILMLRTKNLASPIIAHALWGSVIFIFS